ncbi:MAG: hypothetical protein ISS93_03330 [Candidatus Aenigmarchaeota archaeon]|nr:hypothetical protein [Candidatus Aenigmarchaeota archaeon]
MLTYESLRKFVNDERASKSLIDLPKDFFQQAQEYLKGKESLNEVSWETDSAKRLLQDLLELREKKLLMAAFYKVRSGLQPENLTAEENQFFDQVVKGLEAFRKARSPATKNPASGLEATQDITAFVGLDMKTYGPFKKGDSFQIPGEVASLLVKKGIAKAKH